MKNTKKILGLVLALIVLTLAMSMSIFAQETETEEKGYEIVIYNEDGTEAMTIDGTKSISGFNIKSALEDAYTFGNNGFLFGISGTPTYELVLLQDVEITEMVAIPAGKNVVVNLNGYDITSGYQANSDTKHIYPFDVYGNLTIKDTAGNGSITGRGIFVQDGSTVTVESGSLYAIDSNGGSALFQYGGDIVIKGGRVEQKAEGTYNFAINALGGTVTVKGGWIGGNHGAIAADGAAVVINGGTLVCTGTAGMTDNVLYSGGNGSIVINGGTFVADNDGPAGGCCVYDANGGTTIYAGNFSNSSGGDVWGTTGTTINGGTFENLIETKHVTPGSTIVNGGKAYTKTESGELVEAATEIKVATLAELIEALKANNNLPIVATAIIVIDGDTVLDLNGKTVKAENMNVIRNDSGNLVITNGTIERTGTTAGYAFNVASGTVKLENVTIIGGMYTSGTSAKIVDSNISQHHSSRHTIYAYNCEVDINGGTYHNANAGNSTIFAAGTSVVTIENGTFSIDNGKATLGWTSCMLDANNGGTYVINGGVFKGHFRIQANSSMTINGGTFENTHNEGYSIYNGGVVTVKGGTFTDASSQKFAESNLAEDYKIGEDGKVVSAVSYVASVNGVGYESFADALAAAKAMTGDVVVEILDKVTLNTQLIGSYDSIKFVGKTETAEIYLDLQGYSEATGEKVAFEDLKLSKVAGGYVANAGFMNLAFGVFNPVEVTYTNCTFLNGAYATGKATFTGCDFYSSHDRYSFWAYGDNSNIVIDDCDFVGARGIKMYSENHVNPTIDLTVKNTDFTAADGKPAIVLTYGTSVTLENNAYPSKGVFELDLDGKPNGVSVTSKDTITCINDNGACGVLVDGKIYTTVAQAAEVAVEGSKVTLLYNSAETVELAAGVELDKNGFDAAGITVKKKGLSGTGTEADPFLITSLEDLIWFRENVNAGNSYAGQFVKLTNDIDLDQDDWTPIKKFNGTFDGNGKTISNLWVTGSGAIGFFAQVADQTEYASGTVKNITFNNATIISSNDVAGLIADARSGARINNVKLTGEIQIQGYRGVGGIVGAGFPVMDGCSVEAEGTITATYWGVGGILGFASDAGAKVSNSTIKSVGEGLIIHGELGGVGAVTGTPYGASTNGAIVSGVELTSNNNYYMGYIDASGTVSGNVTVSDTVVKVNGKEIVGRDAIASIGTKAYFSLQDAFNAGGNIVLLDNVAITSTLNIAADKAVVLDLNGKTISQTKAQTGNYEMILNDGNLTIKDSVGGGKISYTDTVGGNFVSNTITNRGTLTLESGRIENMSSQAVANAGYPYAIDTSIWGAASEVVVNIKGGEVYCANYSAIRLRADSETKEVNVNISGGKVYGRIEVQNPSSNIATVGKLTISGGEINKNNSSMAIMIFGGGGTAENLKVEITNGTVVGKVGYSSYFSIEGFDENVITGGIFDTDVSDFCAQGFIAKLVDGKYNVIDDPTTLYINDIEELKAFRDSVNAGNTYAGVTVYLAANIDLENAEWAPIGSDKNHAFKGIFDGQKHTISNLKIINADLDCAGLFGYTNGATIKNVNVKNVNIRAYSHVAAIVGHAYTGNIENCHVSGTINLVAQYAYAAGITADGYVNVRNCSVIADGTGIITVVEKTGAGGITGWRGEGNLVIENCKVNNLEITAWASLGGISGILQYNNTVTGCTVENVKLTKTRENGQASIGIVCGNWSAKSDDNYTITVTNNKFNNISINGTAITSLNVLHGSNYTYYDKVIKLVEENNTYGEVTTDFKVVVKTLTDLKNALAYVKAGEVIELGADIEATEFLAINKSLTINGNGYKITSSANRVFRVTVANVEVTLNNVNMVSTAVRVGTNDIRGISIDANLSNVKLTLNNCTVDFTDASACDWTYAVNVSGNGTGHTVTVNGGTYEGANVINVNGAKNTVVVKNATLNCLYPNNDMYAGACIWVLQNQGSSVEATGNTFNGTNAVAFNVGTGTTVDESNNTDNTTYVVAKIGDTYYTSLKEAIAVGGEVKLLADVALTETITVKGIVTLDLNGKVISGVCNANQASMFIIENTAKLTVKDSSEDKTGKITYAQGSSNVGWTIDVKGALVLESGTIELTGSWSIGYAVDVRPNSWGTAYTAPTSFVMNGGKIISSDGGVRVASSSDAAHTNVSASFTMNGGLIDAAWDGVFVQQSDAIYDKLSVTINAGTIESDLNPIRVYGPAATGYVDGNNCMNITLAGGTFTYTGADNQTWLIDGILRVGGGSSAATIVENGALVVSSAIAQDAVAPEGYKWTEKDGKYTLAKCNYVAEANGVKYESLAEAIANANGSTVTLLVPVTIEKGETLKITSKVTYTSSVLGESMITNKGTLTIAEGGSLEYIYTGAADTSYSKGNYTVNNSGTLVVNGNISASVKDLTGKFSHAFYAINNGGNGSATINAGTVSNANGYAIRGFADNSITVTGGEIVGTRAIWLQLPSSNSSVAPEVNVTITGGTLRATGEPNYQLAIYASSNGSNMRNINIAISGGTFIGDIALTGGQNKDNVETLTITGGTFAGLYGEVYSYGEDAKAIEAITITGGTFATNGAEMYAGDDEYIFKKNADGTYTAQNGKYVAEVNGVKYESLAEAIAKGGEVKLLADVALTETITVTGTVKLDLNGHTITGTDNNNERNFYLINVNKGNLTINDTVGTGAITLRATVERNWSSSSVVIANNQGTVTVNGGTIEHLGGTSMAYAIDNLTNGTIGDAYLVISGGKVESTYFAVRQYANSNTNENKVKVNGGNVGYMWIQSPNSYANNADLTVTAGTVSGICLSGVNAEITLDAKADCVGEVYGNAPASECVIVVDGKYTLAKAVAKIGDTYYAKITDAINAAQNGDTIQLLPGTFDEYVAPWAGDSQHTSEKSITIVGASNFGTVLTGGLYLGYDDSGCRAHTITIKGIAFETKGILVAGQQTVVIDGNKFTNITDLVATSQSASANAISVIGKNVNATITNNIIDTTEASGIHLRDVLNVTVTGNTVAKTKDNSITINPTTGSQGTIVITNNVLSNWGLSGEGRAIRVSGGNNVTISENTMVNANAPEQFVKVSKATSVTVDNNYWNGVSPIARGILLVEDVLVQPNNYYADAERTNRVTINYVASVNGVKYESLQEAFANAQTNDTITLLADITVSEIITINGSVVIDGNGHTITSTAARAINVSGANGVTIKNLTINASGERAINIIQNATNVTIENVTATAANYTVNVATSAPNAVVAIKNSTLNGLCTVNVAAPGASVTIADSTINCNDNNTTAGEGYAALSLNSEAIGGSIIATNTTVYVAEDSDSVKGRNSAKNGTVTINGSTEDVVVMVAVITYEGSPYYYSFASLAQAIKFAKAGDTITLINNINLTEADVKTKVSDKYPVMFSFDKDLTFDFNGCTINVDYKNTTLLYSIFHIANGVNVVINDTTGNGGINVAALRPNDKQTNVGYVIWKQGTEGTLEINGGNYHANDLEDSMVYTNSNRKVTVNGGSFVLDSVGSRKNSSPWIFNAQNQNINKIMVKGGSFNADVFHQYWIFEVGSPENVALKYNKDTGIYTVVNAVAYVNEQHWSGAWYTKNVGYATLEDAIAACGGAKKNVYGSNKANTSSIPEAVILLQDINLVDTTIKIDHSVVLKLNDYTIYGENTRTETHNFLFDVNGGSLTVCNGTISMKHTGENMGWNGATSVFNVTNNGSLTIRKSTVQNHGGTDMNFAIHLNNWGEVTLDVCDSDLLAGYCAVRVFNSGFDMNNVTIKNSKLTGSTRAFWVHNYIGDLDSSKHSDEAINARLNLNIYNNGNTFEITGEATSPIRYGFGNTVYFNDQGATVTVVNSADELKDALENSGDNSEVVLGGDIDLNDLANMFQQP